MRISDWSSDVCSSDLLRGLVGVHTFFRWALRERRLRLCRQLFAGKMTLGDVQRFAPLFDAGVLQPPRWLPDWVSRANGLAGMLAFSLFANRIRLDRVSEAPDRKSTRLNSSH